MGNRCEICGNTENTHEWVTTVDFRHRCLCEKCIDESDEPIAKLARLLRLISSDQNIQGEEHERNIY